MENLETEPTRDELEAAYRRLFDAKIKAICGISLGAIADIVGGAPPHAPTRWSPAEIRLARAVLILRAAVMSPVTDQEASDPGNPVLQAADAFNARQFSTGNYGATGTATLGDVKPDAE